MYIWAVVCENEEGIKNYSDFFMDRAHAQKHVEYLCTREDGYTYYTTSVYVY